MVGLRGVALASVVLLSLTAQAGAESGQRSQPLSGGIAYGVKVLLPNQAPIVAGYVDAVATRAAAPVSFSYPADGSIVRAESVAARSWAAPVNAQARTDLRAVSLFGGEITMDAVVARSWASSRTSEESFAGTAITNLTVLGQAVALVPGSPGAARGLGSSHAAARALAVDGRAGGPRLGDRGRRTPRRRSRRVARRHADPRRLCRGLGLEPEACANGEGRRRRQGDASSPRSPSSRSRSRRAAAAAWAYPPTCRAPVRPVRHRSCRSLPR